MNGKILKIVKKHKRIDIASIDHAIVECIKKYDISKVPDREGTIKYALGNINGIIELGERLKEKIGCIDG